MTDKEKAEEWVKANCDDSLYSFRGQELLQAYLAGLKAREKENDLVKSLLYCTKGTCDNCGFVNCENFQMQRKSEPCTLYISYKDRIKNLEHKNDVLIESYNNSEKKLSEAKELIEDMYYKIPASHSDYYKDVMDRARQFLKED